MDNDKPGIIMEDEAVESPLPVPPKRCAACGGKFIPIARNGVYCPECRKLPQRTREAMRAERTKKLEAGGIDEADGVITYIDPARIKTEQRMTEKERETLARIRKGKEKKMTEDLRMVTMAAEAAPAEPLEPKQAESGPKTEQAAPAPEPDVKIYEKGQPVPVYERDPAEAGAKWVEKDAVYEDLIDMIQRRYGVHLIDATEYMPATLTVDGKQFGGLLIKRSAWEGIDD